MQLVLDSSSENLASKNSLQPFLNSDHADFNLRIPILPICYFKIQFNDEITTIHAISKFI